MKKTTLLSLTFLAILSLSILLLYTSSCKTDPCKGLNCLNNGTCLTGTCQCTMGYEGTTCQTLSNAKFTGKWNANELSGSGVSNIYTATIAALASPINGITITNFGDFGSTYVISGTVSGSTLTIPLQTVGTIIISTGTGTINATDNSMIISYTYTDQNGTVSNSGTWTKQ